MLKKQSESHSDLKTLHCSRGKDDPRLYVVRFSQLTCLWVGEPDHDYADLWKSWQIDIDILRWGSALGKNGVWGKSRKARQTKTLPKNGKKKRSFFGILSNRKMWNWSFWCCCEVAATKTMTLASALPCEAITAATYLNLTVSTFTLLAKLRGRVFHDYLNIWYSFQNIGIIACLSSICRASQYFVGHKGRGKVW